MNQSLQLKELMKRFPEHTNRIYELLSKNEAFIEIAEDFEFCWNKLQRLSQNPAENRPLINQYERTMKELEKELTEYLSL